MCPKCNSTDLHVVDITTGRNGKTRRSLIVSCKGCGHTLVDKDQFSKNFFKESEVAMFHNYVCPECGNKENFSVYDTHRKGHGLERKFHSVQCDECDHTLVSTKVYREVPMAYP